MGNGYYAGLEEQLARGAGMLDPEFRAAQCAWLEAMQNPDGGFPGRSGGSDLYYSGFAARSAGMLGLETREFWAGLRKYLDSKGVSPRDPADALSALMIRWTLEKRGFGACCSECEDRMLKRVRWTMKQFRHPDGGYRKTSAGPASLYQTFLTALAFELLDEDFPAAEDVAGVIASHRGTGGGFSDLAGQLEGTNPTAAAVALAGMFEAGDVKLPIGAAGFIAKMQRDEGGFAAGKVAPMADLMSTFTGLLTLVGMQATGAVKLGAAGRFVKSMALAGGGFTGTGGDTVPDTEYTFYGLGTLAILARHAGEKR